MPRPRPDVVLGTQFLSHFRVVLDARNRSIAFEPVREPQFPVEERQFFVAMTDEDPDAIAKGDSGLDRPEEYVKLELAAENIDVAFFNSLYRDPVTPKSKIVKQYIKPRNMVLMHLGGDANPGPITDEQRRVFPNVVVFQKPLDSRRF